MFGFFIGFLTCWACAGIYSAYLTVYHDKKAGTLKMDFIDWLFLPLFYLIAWPFFWLSVTQWNLEELKAK